MILLENVKFLRNRYPQLLNNLQQYDKVEENLPVRVTETRGGLPNLSIEVESKVTQIHSQYDPISEAKRFIDQFSDQDVHEFEHIFFYGFGMGYHVEQFMDRFPHLSFTIYEPNGMCFYRYLSHKLLSKLPLHRLSNIYVEFTSEFLHHHLDDFLNQPIGKVMFIFLPAYERLFQQQVDTFNNEFKQAVNNKRSALHVNLAFEKRWILNSIINLPHSLGSPNILMTKRPYFENKPALLVAAGPSLQDEIENIRTIKEKGLAYIFAVGSAIIALMKHGIHPDAVCSYDPQGNTVETYVEIIEKNITDIPLIYGSSVGYETVKFYPGPKLHMYTSQDTFAPLCVKRKDDKAMESVSDAPSIAIVTLEMLYKLGANPIILVGQNFAYRNNQFYSQGIGYQTQTQNRPNELSEAELKHSHLVEDVYGGTVFTNSTFDRMRLQMENYTAHFSQGCEIINTTQGGAKIANTQFAALSKLLETKLLEPIVENNWFQLNDEDRIYDLPQIIKEFTAFNDEIKDFQTKLHKLALNLREMEELLSRKNEKKLLELFPKFDKDFKKLKKNRVFEYVLVPMNRVEQEMLGRKLNTVRFEPDVLLKTRKVIDMFGHFFYRCQQEMEQMEPLFSEVQTKIQELEMGQHV